ncbi:MAG: LCP family protein [Actinomycetota bacterium]
MSAEVRPLEPHHPPPSPAGILDPSAPPDTPVAPRRSRRRRILAALSLGVLSLAVVVAAVAAWGLRQFDRLVTIDVAGVEPVATDGAVNWLLVGTDSRDGIDPDDPDAGAFLAEPVSGIRTDTIMVARVDRDAGTVDLLSIPRDLWVEIPDAGPGRINGAFNTQPGGVDGRARLVATIEGNLGIDVDHYAEVDFVGFRRLVDVLEGVPVWFEYPARDVGSGLDIAVRGCHVLDGAQALALARSRTYEEFVDDGWRLDPTGDLGRTARQRLVLARLGDAAAARSTFGTLTVLDDVLDVAVESVILEDGATTGDLIGLIRIVSGAGADGLVGHSLPVLDRRTSGGAQVLELDPAEAEAVLAIFRDGVPAGPIATIPTAPVVGDEDAAPAESDPGSAPSAPPGYGRFGFSGEAGLADTPCS